MTSQSSNSIYYCPVCGGDLIGDGYTTVVHCENVEAPWDIEPDAAPIFCINEEKDSVIQ